jgi:hypothetical protein
MSSRDYLAIGGNMQGKAIEGRSWYKLEESVTIRGSSKWAKIIFKWKKNDKEFYRVEKDANEMKTIPDQLVKRREYFNGKLERTYEDWGNSFVEFVDLMDRENTSPDKVPLSFYAMHIPFLRHERWLYAKYYLKFFGSKKAEKDQKKKIGKKSQKIKNSTI